MMLEPGDWCLIRDVPTMRHYVDGVGAARVVLACGDQIGVPSALAVTSYVRPCSLCVRELNLRDRERELGPTLPALVYRMPE